MNFVEYLHIIFILKIIMKEDIESLQIQQFDIKEIMPDSTILCLGQRRSGKCFAKDTYILMYDGTTKYVQDIAPGDIVMGDDNTPRTVLDKTAGHSALYSIYHISDNRLYTVNEDHVLCLLYYRDIFDDTLNSRFVVYYFDDFKLQEKQEYFEYTPDTKNTVYTSVYAYNINVYNIPKHISVRRYLTLPNNIKQKLYGYSQAVDFKSSKENILNARDYGTILISMGYVIKGGVHKTLPTKHSSLPEVYYTVPLEDRFALLEEIIDDTFTFSVDISNLYCYMRLLWSMGLRFVFTRKSNYYEISVHIDDYIKQKDLLWNTDVVKKNTKDTIMKIPFKINVVYTGDGDWYGFSVDKNHRFMLGNYIVTHNSWVIRDIMFHRQKIPTGVVFSGTERASPFFGKFIPDIFIYNEYKNEVVEKILKRQEKKIEQAKKKYNSEDGKVPENNMFVIMDDLMDRNNIWKTSESLRTIFFNGRHYNIFFIIALQYLKSITPDMRGNFDYVFIFNTAGIEMRRKIYSDYGAMIPTFDHFCNILDQCTTDHSCLVIKTTGNSISEQVFWYKAKLRENFRVGIPAVWNFHQEKYDNKYKQRENKEFYKVEEVKKKFANTKKLKVLISRKNNEIVQYRPEDK